MITRRDIPPFETADGYLSAVRYRSSSAKSFQELKPTVSNIYAPCDDIRSIPRHELEIELDPSSLPTTYANDLKRLELLILCRDPVLKQELVLATAPVESLPASFVLDHKKLVATGSPRELSVDISICAISTKKSDEWPRRRASRLTTWHLEIANHRKGPRFPWVRKTADNFKAAGLPPHATWYVNLLDNPEALLTDENLGIDDALEVWVHEDAWALFQQSEAASGVAAIHRLFVAQVTSDIFSLAAQPLRDKVEIARGSLMQQLLDHVTKGSGAKGVNLKEKLKAGAVDIAPYVAAAYNVNSALQKALE